MSRENDPGPSKPAKKRPRRVIVFEHYREGEVMGNGTLYVAKKGDKYYFTLPGYEDRAGPYKSLDEVFAKHGEELLSITHTTISVDCPVLSTEELLSRLRLDFLDEQGYEFEVNGEPFFYEEDHLHRKVIVFKHYWEGGFMGNGTLYVIKKGDKYYYTHPGYEDPAGPYKSLDEVFAEHGEDLFSINDTTISVHCPVLSTEELLSRLRLDCLDEQDYEFEVNGELYSCEEVHLHRKTEESSDP
jgi:hypothetical protein